MARRADFRRILLRLLLLTWFCGLPAGVGAEVLPAPRPARVLPGEFERQDAVLVCWDVEDAVAQRVVVQIVAAVWRKLNVLMLVPHQEGQQAAGRALKQAGVPARAVKFMQVPFDSVWARDYGPIVVISADGDGELLDADYGNGERIGDDTVPAALAGLLAMPTLQPPLAIDGGNLLSNGAGLCLTTTTLIDRNVERGYTEQHVRDVLKTFCGAQKVVFLEPLAGEPTGHIDMFATFVTPDTVLIGEYPPGGDPLNAEILDRNAQRLSQVRTAIGPLKVFRIPMPPGQDLWRTYTNVLYANGTLLMPVYPGIDPDGQAMATMLYRQLLPGWQVVGIDCGRMIEWGGAVHCLTRNLSRVPNLVSRHRARALDQFLPPPLWEAKPAGL